jgi:protein tyrosine/serine phosphatase
MQHSLDNTEHTEMPHADPTPTQDVTIATEIDLRSGSPIEVAARVFWEPGEHSPTVVWLSARSGRHPYPVETLRHSGWESKAIDAAYEAGLAERSAA